MMWLFPFSGLIISDPPNALNNSEDFYLRRRAAWITTETGREIIGEESFAFLQEEYGEFEGFLAVRWSVPAAQNDFAITAEVVFQRAKEIGALLTLSLFPPNPIRSCALSCLYKPTAVPTRHSIAIGANNVHHMDVEHPGNIMIKAEPPIQLTRDELSNAMLTSAEKLILTEEHKLKGEFRSIVRQAFSLTAQAFVAPTKEEQCLRSMNALETLMGRSWELSKQRTKALLGQAAYNTYEAATVFQKRHDIVHHGATIKESIGLNAIFMTIDCLRRLCQLIEQLSANQRLSQARVLELLDFEKTYLKKQSAAHKEAELTMLRQQRLQPIQNINPYHVH